MIITLASGLSLQHSFQNCSIFFGFTLPQQSEILKRMHLVFISDPVCFHLTLCH